MRRRAAALLLGTLCLPGQARADDADRWVEHSAINICPTLKIESNCPGLATGGHVKLLTKEQDPRTGQFFYKVEGAGTIGYVPEYTFDRAVTNVDPTREKAAAKDGRRKAAAAEKARAKSQSEQRAAADLECRRLGGPVIGMTKEQVIGSCWGNPTGSIVTHTAGGTTEQLTYRYRGYVYIHDGKVAAVQSYR